MAIEHSSVAEMQGLYGPFTITERVVQKIWLRGDFLRRGLQLMDGRALEIRSIGVWNLLGGPDFKQARLAIGGRELSGDVEVHFHMSDWAAHGHDADPAYNNVILHVVLFPPAENERLARTSEGREIPVLVLLPRLHRDLEEYVSDDALEVITERDEWERFAELAAYPPDELRRRLQVRAAARWRQKVHFAALRTRKLGVAGAAHHSALEILGYRYNRAAMLAVAARHPLTEWAGGKLDPGRVFEEDRMLWQLHGLRPANHPRLRLMQYARWVRSHPDWPERLLAFETNFVRAAKVAVTAEHPRRALGLRALREELAREVVAGEVGGTRFDNLVCDGFLPLVAAARPDADVFTVWFHWFLGDVPAQVRLALPRLGVAGRGLQPVCHGWAQGVLGWLLAGEARASD